MKEDIKSVRCEVCGSTVTYLRIKTMQRVCRNCGNVAPVKIEVKK